MVDLGQLFAGAVRKRVGGVRDRVSLRGDLDGLNRRQPGRRDRLAGFAALLHHGYTPEQVALRLEQRDQVFNGSADPYLPDDLPVAVLADGAALYGEGDGGGLSAEEAARVRECYEAMPRRTRYILTVCLGLGVPRRTLRDAAEPYRAVSLWRTAARPANTKPSAVLWIGPTERRRRTCTRCSGARRRRRRRGATG
jgi:hypothetical protein